MTITSIFLRYIEWMSNGILQREAESHVRADIMIKAHLLHKMGKEQVPCAMLGFCCGIRPASRLWERNLDILCHGEYLCYDSNGNVELLQHGHKQAECLLTLPMQSAYSLTFRPIEEPDRLFKAITYHLNSDEHRVFTVIHDAMPTPIEYADLAQIVRSGNRHGGGVEEMGALRFGLAISSLANNGLTVPGGRKWREVKLAPWVPQFQGERG